MFTMFLVCFLICLWFFSSECSEEYINIQDEEISAWLTYPIHNLSDPIIQQILSESINNISNNGLFIIRNMLSSQGLNMFQNEIYEYDSKNKSNKQIKLKSYCRKSSMNIFQQTKNQYYDSNDIISDNLQPLHPKELFMRFSMNVINHIDLTKTFDALYYYPSLLNFFKYIVTNSYKNVFDDLYLSNDFDGNLYAFIGDENDEGFWHFDDAPFSCIWMINKPISGGNLHYLYIENSDDHDQNISNKIGQIITKYVIDKTKKYDIEQFIDNEENIYIKYVDTDPGDIYCFKGRVLLHKSSVIKGNEPRIVLATTFADIPDFMNTNIIQQEFFGKSDLGHNINKN